MERSCFVEIHALQTVPPSCMNRDDTGAPKSCVYGGVPRARVSSQCWKRATRKLFPKEYLGVRTLKVPALIQSRIMDLDDTKDANEAMQLAKAVLGSVGIKASKKNPDAVAAAMFLSDVQVEALARQALANPGDKAAAKKALYDNVTVDIALFGRMVAAEPDLNVDASAYVAHAVSTHTVHTEYDYFTAVDEMNKEGESGAGHLDTAEFNSSVLYRYACVDVSKLSELVGDESVKAAGTFVRCFLTSMPSGKSKSYANLTLPDYIRIYIRNDSPMSFAGAFEKPVKTTEGGFFDGSVEALEAYAADLQKKYGSVPALDLSFDNGNIFNVIEMLEEGLRPMVAGGQG